MKKSLIIVSLLIFIMMAFCGCKREVQMVEDMVSTIMSTEGANNGTVTDGDGFIGNDDHETTKDVTSVTEVTEKLIDENVM